MIRMARDGNFAGSSLANAPGARPKCPSTPAGPMFWNTTSASGASVMGVRGPQAAITIASGRNACDPV